MPVRAADSDRAKQIRAWAYDNAFTLIFVSMLAVVTWVIVVVANYIFGS